MSTSRLLHLKLAESPVFYGYFTILDTAASGYQLKFKEAIMYITWEKPILNQQKHVA